MTLFCWCSLEQVVATDSIKATMFPCEREVSEGVSKRYGVAAGLWRATSVYGGGFAHQLEMRYMLSSQ